MGTAMPRVVLYTDGSAKCLGPNGDVNGGWAYIMRWRDMETSDSGSATFTTNNRMELKAIVEGIKQLAIGCTVDLYSDSQYALSMVNNLKGKWSHLYPEQWRTKTGSKPQNFDLLEELYGIMKKFRHQIYVHWVKSHVPVSEGGHELNARCDSMAYKAMTELCASQGRPLLQPRMEKIDYKKLNKIKKFKKKKHWRHDHTFKMSPRPDADLW